jgi:hypothetical protein
MTSDEKKCDAAEALSGVDSAIQVGFTELAGRIAKFQDTTVAEAISSLSEAIYPLDATDGGSLSHSVEQAGSDIRAGLEELAKAIRESKKKN